MNKLVLSKDSDELSVKRYFEGILSLTKNGEQFPINLDDVWMLGYSQKKDAVRLLTESGQFFEGIDYILLSKNESKSEGRRYRQNTSGRNK